MTPTHIAAEVKPSQAEHSNRLAREKSPYLLQHAHNPVDWFPWGEEAFAKARRENKPIFLSIGYSTCHWCHVMAHESFENEEVAAVMNREFVNIKVDREERPDVDRVYMTFVQATTGGGGWPMSVWLTPDLKPFVGGTYFPPQDRYGHPGFKKVLERIAAIWKEQHEKIVEQGNKITQALRESAASVASSEELSAQTLTAAYEQISRSFDPNEGGFGGPPKFPHPVTLNFLSRFYARAPKSDSGKRALEMNLFTLRKMAAGGMHDHLGGGFHRYSVDAFWHVPHFEKMLYDQAQLALAYLDAVQTLSDPRLNPLPGQGEEAAKRQVRDEFESVARDILDYVRRDMTSKQGGFFSAEDADSLIPVAAVYDRRPEDSGAHGAPLQKSEGAFYVWTKKEIGDALGDAAEIFDFHFGVAEHGNAPPGSDPQGEFRDKNILIQRHTLPETAQHFKKSEDEIRQTLAHSREKLFSIRNKRPRPHLDDKIITAWNGLMISAFARAAQIFDDASYLDLATRAARFVRENLFDAERKVLLRSFRDGRSQTEGFADDYAFLIQGLLDLYEAGFDIEWLKLAIELQATQDRLFLDEKNGGYFSVSGKDASILMRMKDDHDSAEPAASSVAALNLLRLAQIRNDNELRERAQKTIHAFSAQLNRIPMAMPQMLVALDYSLGPAQQIVIAGPPPFDPGAASKIDSPQTKTLLAEVHKHFLPHKVLILADGAGGQKFLGEKNEALRAMTPVDGQAAAYVCENFTCRAPVASADALRELLAGRN